MTYLKILHILANFIEGSLTYTYRSESFDILGTLLNLKILLIVITTAAILLQRKKCIRERLKLSSFKLTLVFRFLFSERFTINDMGYRFSSLIPRIDKRQEVFGQRTAFRISCFVCYYEKV